MADVKVDVPEELAPLVSRLIAHARAGTWGDFEVRLEGGRVVGKLKATITETLSVGAPLPAGGGPRR